MFSSNQIDQVIGQPVYGSDRDKVGKVGTIYLDDVTGKPEWATVHTGLFGTKESFVPVADADVTEAGLSVPYTKEQVKNAPRVDAEQGHLSQDEEAELYRHYELAYSEDRSDSGLAAGHVDQGEHDHSDRVPAASKERGDHDGDGVFDDVEGRVEGHDTSGLTTDEAMTRSEEQLKVGTEKVETGKARLRKYVVTEEQTVTVPVTREEVRIEREPITQADMGKAMDGPAISEEEHEMTLTEERVVVQKEVVPIERVTLAKETVTEQQQVTEQVRKEQVETDSDVAAERKDRV